jgi:hypothetical protein
MTKTEARNVLERLKNARYSDAKAIFWTGSVVSGDDTERSDLDIIVVFKELTNAYREAFLYEGWNIDAFIHDSATLAYFFEKIDKSSGLLALPRMVQEGLLITTPSAFSTALQQRARACIEAGPPAWDKAEIDQERFLITDKLDDILAPKDRAEQIASTAWLFEALASFYFRAQGKWRASGKSIVRYLRNEDADFADRYLKSFEDVFENATTDSLETLVHEVLAPYGGLLWEGYVSDAPKEYRTHSLTEEDIPITTASNRSSAITEPVVTKAHPK